MKSQTYAKIFINEGRNYTADADADAEQNEEYELQQWEITKVGPFNLFCTKMIQ